MRFGPTHLPSSILSLIIRPRLTLFLNKDSVTLRIAYAGRKTLNFSGRYGDVHDRTFPMLWNANGHHAHLEWSSSYMLFASTGTGFAPSSTPSTPTISIVMRDSRNSFLLSTHASGCKLKTGMRGDILLFSADAMDEIYNLVERNRVDVRVINTIADPTADSGAEMLKTRLSHVLATET